MELLAVATVIGQIPAAIAQSKGRSFIAWWFYGAALFIVALLAHQIRLPSSWATRSGPPPRTFGLRCAEPRRDGSSHQSRGSGAASGSTGCQNLLATQQQFKNQSPYSHQ